VPDAALVVAVIEVERCVEPRREPVAIRQLGRAGKQEKCGPQKHGDDDEIRPVQDTRRKWMLAIEPFE